MTPERAKNVVLISIDTLRYDCLGACPDKARLRAWGCQEKLRTPNLDAFFRDSRYFTHARTAAPYTTASHASVMTGLYPNHHGVRPFYKWGLAEGVGTLAEELKAHGYQTASAQEGGAETALRTGSSVLRGFDACFREEAEACAYCSGVDRPKLLFLHTMDVHIPYCWAAIDELRKESLACWEQAAAQIYRRLRLPAGSAPDEADKMGFQRWVARRARERLGDRGSVELFLDWYIRGVNLFDRVRWPRIVSALKQAGLYDDALIVVFADHGEGVLPDYTGPPIAHAELLEDVLRVPLAIRAPGFTPGVVEKAVCLVDVAPTVMDYLGLSPASVGRSGSMDGASLLAAGAPPARGAPVHFAEAWRSSGPVRKGKAQWRGRAADPCAPYQVCVTRGDTKVLWHPGETVLRRFLTRAAQRRARLKLLRRRAYNALATLRSVYRRLLPYALRQLPWRLIAWSKGRSRKGHPGRSVRPEDDPRRRDFPWRQAPSFLIDLSLDPTERRPQPASPEHVRQDHEELLLLIRRYWEDGCCGPEIDLTSSEQEDVVEHLRGLGYVE